MAIKTTVLTTGIQEIFSIPAKGNVNDPDIIKAVTTIIFCNKIPFSQADPTANSDVLTVYAVPEEDADTFNGSPSSNIIVNRLEIPAGETFTFESEKIILTNGDSIRAVTTHGNIVCTVSSVDLT